MRRLLVPFVLCCALAMGCGASDEPADPDNPDDCVGDDCASEGSDAVDSEAESSEGSETDANSPTTDTEPADDADLEPQDDATTDLVVTAVAEAWGIDEDLARCVVEELSLDDPAAIDPAAVDDPTKEICGTSLLELMANAG